MSTLRLQYYALPAIQRAKIGAVAHPMLMFEVHGHGEDDHRHGRNHRRSH